MGGRRVIGDDSVTIELPAAVIFDALADGEQNVHWRTSVSACTRLTGDGGAGTEWQMSRRHLGRNQPRDYVVEQYEYPTLYGVRFIGGRARLTATYTLTERDGVTEVALHLVARSARGLRLLGRSVPGEMGADLDDLQRLRSYLERRAQEAAPPS